MERDTERNLGSARRDLASIAVPSMVTSSLRALVWLAAMAAGSAQAEPFAFAGFDRNMDMAVWMDGYPQSSGEFPPGADAQGSPDNPGEWTPEFLRARR